MKKQSCLLLTRRAATQVGSSMHSIMQNTDLVVQLRITKGNTVKRLQIRFHQTPRAVEMRENAKRRDVA